MQDFNDLCPVPLSKPEHPDRPTVTFPGCRGALPAWSRAPTGISLLLKPRRAKEPLPWILLGGWWYPKDLPLYSNQAWHPSTGGVVHPSALIVTHGNAKVIISPLEFSFA